MAVSKLGYVLDDWSRFVQAIPAACTQPAEPMQLPWPCCKHSLSLIRSDLFKPLHCLHRNVIRREIQRNEWKCIDFKWVRKPIKSRINLTHHVKKSSRWAEQKTSNAPKVSGGSPLEEEKVYGGKNLPKSQVLSSEWKTKWVREENKSEDGEENWRWWTVMCDTRSKTDRRLTGGQQRRRRDCWFAVTVWYYDTQNW